MTWLFRFLGWLLGWPPPRTFEDVARELVEGLEDGTITLDPPQ